jgi:hypothetical protein
MGVEGAGALGDTMSRKETKLDRVRSPGANRSSGPCVRDDRYHNRFSVILGVLEINGCKTCVIFYCFGCLKNSNEV